MAAHGADGGTSARRRRERRLRSWLRHEQQSIAAVLANHSFDKVGTASGVLRNQKTATRTGKGEESEKKYTAKFRKTPPPQAAATVYYPMTDDEGGELSAGVRPAPLEERRPQGKLERHAGIGYEIVQNFDVPVPQMVEQLPKSFNSSQHSHLFPNRSSQCRRSCLTMFLRDVCVATRSWRNSWRKCRRFYTFSSSGFPSRSSTIQFRMVPWSFRRSSRLSPWTCGADR